MPSKDIIDRIKMAHGLTAIIDQLTEPVAERMAAQLTPHLQPGEELPDLELVQRLTGRLVMSRIQALIAADEAYNDALLELGDELLDFDFDELDDES